MTAESERATRKKRIDKLLRAAGWRIESWRVGMITSRLMAHAVREFPTSDGRADYALFVDGKLVGVVEAKKLTVGAENVLEQAKRYSRNATVGVGNWRGYRVPFLYSSNGKQVYHIDVRNDRNLSRPIAGFHTPAALKELLDRSDDPSWFRKNPLPTEKLRDYQRDCIRAIEAAVTTGRRNMLVAMATGTGKTFTIVSQIYRLLESGQFKRILFLVDRRALAVQAVREFAAYTTPRGGKFTNEYEVFHQRFQTDDCDDRSFTPNVLPSRHLKRPDGARTFVYVSTIQRMAINLFGSDAVRTEDPESDRDSDAGKLDIPIHAFDLIIADECHRGYTAQMVSLWRNTIEHFDAVRIGLTATPAAHTLALFDKVVYRYTVDEAIQSGYLCSYDPVRIDSKVRMKGAFLKKGELVGRIDTETGDETLDRLEDQRAFSKDDIEFRITAPDSNRKIVEEIARHAAAHEKTYGRFPKTLIFAANDLPHTSHADTLVRICRKVFARGDDFVQKITGGPTVDHPLKRIREFRNRPNPRIVVTVDLLSTGVDIPAIEFIVFLRPVRSRILWTQMLGRGTRKCGDIHKEKFVVFDCFGGSLFEYFKNATEFDMEGPANEPVGIAEIIDRIDRNEDRDYHTKVLIKRLRRIDRTMSDEARRLFKNFIPEGDIARFADDLPNLLKKRFAETMKVLRKQSFQELLEDYPRAKRQFLVGHEVEDEVGSEVMIGTGAAYQKPEDYLDKFARFVRHNRDRIEAFRVLLKRPKGWRTGVLDSLRRALQREDFTEAELQKAHGYVYQKPLADIISMIKHAARRTAPILTAEERAARAVAAVTARRKLTAEQRQWMRLIQGHLAQHLSMEMEDLENAPILLHEGGLGAARRVFGDQLETLVRDLNGAIAA